MTRVSNLKSAVAATFGNAADTYHSAADVQREVASRLARRISDLALPAHPRVLEIGCGTGFLNQALANDLGTATWLLSDLSESMVRRAKANLTARRPAFLVMDGEAPAVASESFQLVCASLVFQWFENLPAAIARLLELLAPGGVLAFSTLTADSFPEWRAAHQALGSQSAVRSYPTVKAIAQMIPKGFKVGLETEAIARAYRDAHAFLRHWKEIGTHVPDAGHRPLTPGTMRKLLRRFERGMTVTYHVTYATILKN